MKRTATAIAMAAAALLATSASPAGAAVRSTPGVMRRSPQGSAHECYGSRARRHRGECYDERSPNHDGRGSILF